jgi:ElaB/YqjD/DUF883 family membrane-anchored ribosome-binding protein
MATRSAKSAEAEVDVEVPSGINGSEGIEDDIDDIRERLEALEQQLRIAGDRLLESAKTLSSAAGRQMQTHPMAAFGVAFLAGITVARLLRR